jgi:hypothetical protein
MNTDQMHSGGYACNPMRLAMALQGAHVDSEVQTT